MKKSIFVCLCLLAFFSGKAENTVAYNCLPGSFDSGPLPHPDDCRKFIICVVLEGTTRIPLMFQCQAGLVFSPDERICTYESEAKNPAPPCNYGANP
ncbi:hypothetical protein DBR43_29360 [Pedobacter sp. KBW06]|uniref:chitin binding peritrophin-A domain-containing protein n=1 Tax=Pedobacter sp. KBW06 TaxID=2153359 RepID=UPI000F5919AE|nr:chitin binding peritrophin-A domain-containing protein [Pedobacter sp. KBW06]RQO66333.1 hypothetical protein DBR43_29360 [Pedobacter sp. KBW06]